jgi:tRNA-2-methylthio-N6-dimethylallyladenosine synthase
MAASTFHLTTFGCQMNQHDSERIDGLLESLGYAQAEAASEADLIILNTCSIRESADRRLETQLGNAKRFKAARPGVIVAVGGCWAQSLKDEVFERYPFVDVAFGPGQVDQLGQFLLSDSVRAQGYFEFGGFTGELPMRSKQNASAWMQISVGCNQKCSYCIVPSTRGLEVSRPFADLVVEAEALVARGAREITLLGQNVNSYGRDLRPDRRSFSELLVAVDAVDGVDRLRYTSPHPQDMRADVVAAHLELESVCEHIHLPLQSGSSKILKAMRRTYDRDRYLGRVAMIRDAIPDISLTTDIIVGFPGENENDFEQTLALVEEAQFDAAYTFIYSPRRGTEAALLTEELVSAEEASERIGRLIEVVQRVATARAQRFVGRSVEVLVEGQSRTDPERLRGRSRHNKAVNFSGVAVPGDLVEVEIEGATSTSLKGQATLVASALR